MAKKTRKILGLIPARGGSKSIPNKNIVGLAGNPLLSYAITALKESSLVDRIIVSTNDRKIAKVALKYGAEVPFYRPDELATDRSKVFEALKFTLQKLYEEEGYAPDYVVTVQPTSPLISNRHIDEVLSLALKKKADSAISVEKLPHRYHPFNIRCIQEGSLRFWKEEEHYQTSNRQERPSFFAFGNVYVTKGELMRQTGRLEGKDNFFVEIDHWSCIDIDDYMDLEVIEAILDKKIIGKNKSK